jgi:hypothetical protein
MKKTQLRHIIRQSIKNLVNEQRESCKGELTSQQDNSEASTPFHRWSSCDPIEFGSLNQYTLSNDLLKQSVCPVFNSATQIACDNAFYALVYSPSPGTVVHFDHVGNPPCMWQSPLQCVKYEGKWGSQSINTLNLHQVLNISLHASCDDCKKQDPWSCDQMLPWNDPYCKECHQMQPAISPWYTTTGPHCECCEKPPPPPPSPCIDLLWTSMPFIATDGYCKRCLDPSYSGNFPVDLTGAPSYYAPNPISGTNYCDCCPIPQKSCTCCKAGEPLGQSPVTPVPITGSCSQFNGQSGWYGCVENTVFDPAKCKQNYPNNPNLEPEIPIAPPPPSPPSPPDVTQDDEIEKLQKRAGIKTS